MACDNPFFKSASKIFLGHLDDLRGLSTCVEALVSAGVPVVTGNGRCFLKIEDVARAVEVLRPLVTETTPGGRAAEEMLEDIDDHLRGLWLMSPAGLPIRHATEEEVKELTGGYVPEGLAE